MIILVINCGSSSIKYQLLDMKSDDVFDVIAKGIAEKIGLPAGILQYAPAGKDKIVTDIPIPDHKVGMQLILAALTDPKTGVLKSLEDIEAVGHRIVQGGDFFSGSVLVTDDVIDKIAFCADFAPCTTPPTFLVSGLCRMLFLQCLRLLHLTLPSTRPCLLMHTCTAFRMSIMRSTACAVTVPTARPTSLWPA